MKKNKTTVIAIVLLVVVIVFTVIWRLFMYETPQIKFVKNMGNGINIGNSLDSYVMHEHSEKVSKTDFETAWGNPPITNQLFVMIKEAGFSTVRIPVTWQNHLQEEGTVKQEWMDRVQEVVDMALSQDLYVILNTHHEEWMDLQLEKEVQVTEKFVRLWTQISQRFINYDERLIFEGMNEPRLRNSSLEWTSGNEELREMVNRLNDRFVETVRSTGGENGKRYLMICPYAARYEKEALEDLKIPKGNIIVSIHMYSPYKFCQDDNGVTEWNPDSSQYAKDVAEVKLHFRNMNKIFVRKGIPVILTEFGCMDKDNLEDRIQWLQFYKKEARKAGVTYLWWDNGKEYQIMDREKYQWTFPQIKEELTKKS